MDFIVIYFIIFIAMPDFDCTKLPLIFLIIWNHLG